jgi:hypothetical protein
MAPFQQPTTIAMSSRAQSFTDGTVLYANQGGDENFAPAFAFLDLASLAVSTCRKANCLELRHRRWLRAQTTVGSVKLPIQAMNENVLRRVAYHASGVEKSIDQDAERAQ